MFRYSTARFNSVLMTLGVIRIGTLHDFRRIEHRTGIRDPKEGKKNITHYIDSLFISDLNDPTYRKSIDFRALETFSAIRIDKAKARNVTIKNIGLSRPFDHPDCFILCTSRFCSKETMRQFEGAESCLEIVGIEDFYRALTETLNSITHVIFRGIHKVKYQSREEVWNGRDWGAHPALINDPAFEAQGELRAIWQPTARTPIGPIITGNYKLGDFCRIVSL